MHITGEYFIKLFHQHFIANFLLTNFGGNQQILLKYSPVMSVISNDTIQILYLNIHSVITSLFSVAKATLEIQMSAQDAVILKQRCGYIQKDVVMRPSPKHQTN